VLRNVFSAVVWLTGDGEEWRGTAAPREGIALN
jgi:hypothetical protein